MASLVKIFVLLTGALLLSVATVAKAHGVQFVVEGEVYCEVCRTNFINKLSVPMAGATVRLECRGEEVTNITYKLEGTTDSAGHYELNAVGDHGTEECSVTLVKSSQPDCDIMPNEGWAIEPTAKITLTKNSGFHDNKRHANPLGFTKKERDAGCAELFKELDLNPDEMTV
ncbi:olee1-like protein [Salvia divinorum]|uniref:Olee1-like protein n=1 Tax=Salvia divinorum TaxID=28513 RepID=A0ABD1IGE9_SALDI